MGPDAPAVAGGNAGALLPSVLKGMQPKECGTRRILSPGVDPDYPTGVSRVIVCECFNSRFRVGRLTIPNDSSRVLATLRWNRCNCIIRGHENRGQCVWPRYRTTWRPPTRDRSLVVRVEVALNPHWWPVTNSVPNTSATVSISLSPRPLRPTITDWSRESLGASSET